MATTNLRIVIYCLIGIICLGGLSLYFYYDPSLSQIDFFPKCPFHSLTSLHCPGCGSQRAIHDYLNGNVVNGLKHNLLIPVVAFVLLYHFYVSLFKLINKKAPQRNLLDHPKFSLIILIIVLSFWVFRNIPVAPFHYLAP
ncbi:Protein of unknown function [Zhouia amylolytica]|uniref:DUF2752 domain-containing protein n=1 Tax=Zhouia amylolytica TaxID=376730 RepID=A0A1I6Q9K1_9FLAO|nr:Protein of unknown function [Zhouia amylolytica]